MDCSSMKAEPPDLALVEYHINLLNPKGKEKSEFLNHIQTISKAVQHFELATLETNILSRILPVIHDRFEQVLSTNLSIFEFLDDDLMSLTIKDSLQEVFQLTEIIQEILNFISGQSPFRIGQISPLADFLPKYVQLFAAHYNSSDKYRDTFVDDLSKITVVLKHFYTSFLYLLPSFLNLDENDVKLLAEVILSFCQMANVWHPLDKTVLFSTWKCIGAIIANHSDLLAEHIDVNIPIKLLTTNVCQILEQLAKEDSDYQFEIKRVCFLLNIVFTVWTYTFYQQINNFASELLVFYVRVLSYSQEYYKFHKMADGTIRLIEAKVYRILEQYLQHLILGQVNILKEHLLHFSGKLKVSENNNPYGLLILFNHILKIIVDDKSDWSNIIFAMIQEIFDALKQCRHELFWKPFNNGVYDTLIVNITAAILVHDSSFQCPELLIKYLLQNNPFVAMLALEVYSSLIRNIQPEDCLSLIINLLYSLDFTLGYFTHRPEMVYLKCLLQRTFSILTDPLKEQILKMFQPDQNIQVWRFLEFGSVPGYKINQILQPVIENTSESIKAVAGSLFNENYIFNVGEGLHLISTAKNLNLHDESLKEVVTFLDSFWAREFRGDMLDNNWFKYLVFKVDALTVTCIQNNCLNSQLVFSNLEILSKYNSYWIPIFTIISLLLKSKLINKEEILSQIADLLPLVIGKTIWLEENYLEMLRNLNEHNNETLNILLDSLKPNMPHKIFECIESFKQKCVDINLAHFELLKIAPILQHKCIVWKNNVTVQDEPLPVHVTESCKFDSRKENVHNKRRYPNDKESPKAKKQSKTPKKEHTKTLSSIDIEDDSCVSEVISRLKGDVKCLVKVCYQEKLTGKNCADLRMLMGQISSVIR